MRNVPMIAAALLALAACAGEPIPEDQSSIPFLSRATVRDWDAADDKTLYIQRMNNAWYRADLLGPCTGLPFATVIGFKNERGSSRFDRFGEIIVEGKSCKVVSLTESPPPPAVQAAGRKPRAVGADDASR